MSAVVIGSAAGPAGRLRGNGQTLVEHESEKVRGLPGELPEGEILLWQGAPNWWRLAKRAMHVQGLAIYFGAMLLWYAITVWNGDVLAFGRSMAPLLGATGFVLAVLTFYAWLVARSTVYSLTDRRIVVRCGVALSKAVNIPFTLVAGASLRTLPDGSGDIVLNLEKGHRIPYFLIWPHAKPWRMTPTYPALRAVPQAAQVAQRLAQALAAATGGQAEPIVVASPGRATRPAAAPAGAVAA